jgi:hypothetical protein
MRRNVSHLRRLQPYRSSEFLILDAATRVISKLSSPVAEKPACLPPDCTVTRWARVCSGIGCYPPEILIRSTRDRRLSACSKTRRWRSASTFGDP